MIGLDIITTPSNTVQFARELKAKGRTKYMRIGVSKASGVLKREMAGNAPKRYGILKKSLRVRVRHYQNKETWVGVVGPKSSYVVEKGVRKSGPNAGKPIRHRPSKYAHLVERGTARAPAQPFVERSVNSVKSQFSRIIADKVRQMVSEGLAKK